MAPRPKWVWLSKKHDSPLGPTRIDWRRDQHCCKLFVIWSCHQLLKGTCVKGKAVDLVLVTTFNHTRKPQLRMIYYLRGTIGWLLVSKPIVALISIDRKVLESTNKVYWRGLLWWRQNPVDQLTETLKLPTQLHHYWLVFPVQLMGTVEKKLKKRC